MEKLLIVLVLFLVTPLIGQKKSYKKAGHTKPLRVEQGYPKNQLILQAKEVKDSFSRYYLVYFINSTDEAVVVNSYLSGIDPNIGVINSKDKWVSLERRGWCGTGYGQAIIPANHYAWVRCHALGGYYEANTQFSLVLNDTVIYSNHLKTKIPKQLQYGHFGNSLAELMHTIKADKNLDSLSKSFIYTKIGKEILQQNRDAIAITALKKAINLDNTNELARYLYGKALLKTINACFIR